MSSWYYKPADRPEVGPLSIPELKRAFRSGAVPPDTPVRRSGSMRWVAGRDVKGLFKTPPDDLPDLVADPADLDAPFPSSPAAEEVFDLSEYLEPNLATPRTTAHAAAGKEPASDPSPLPPELDFLKPFMSPEATSAPTTAVPPSPPAALATGKDDRPLRASSRTFDGWGLDPAVFAKAAADWLGWKGYDTQILSPAGTHLVQARTPPTWKAWFRSCPSLDVRVSGEPDHLTIEFTSGTWVHNGSEGAFGHAGRSVGGFFATVLHGDEWRQLQKGFWQAVQLCCRTCGALDWTEVTGRTVIGSSRRDGGVQADGTLPGSMTFRTSYRCTACDRRWAGDEQVRHASLCPECEAVCEPAATGETILKSVVVGESSPGQFAGDVTYRTHYRATGCGHAWDGPVATRRAVVCPACVRPVTGNEVRRVVARTFRRTEMRTGYQHTTYQGPHYQDGGSSASWTTVPVSVEYEVTVGIHRCEHCSHEWRGSQQVNSLG